MSNNEYSRRDLLKLGGTGTATALAGCSSLRDEETQPDDIDGNDGNGEEYNDSNKDDHSTSNDETETEQFYDITGYELQTTPIDLTDIKPLEGDQYSQEEIEQNFYSEPTLTAYLEDDEGRETEEELTDLVEFHLEQYEPIRANLREPETEEVQTKDNKIPEYELKRNQKLRAILDHQEIQEKLEEEGYNVRNVEESNPETDIEKHVPEHYRRDVTVNGSKEPWLDWQETILGERPEPYTTEFQFDTQDFTIQEFYENRNEMVASLGSYEEIRQAGEDLDLRGLTKREKIIEVSHYVNDNLIYDSAETVDGALMMERILREHGDVDEPIAAGGFTNPADPNETRGNHGSQMIHVDGDNYHSETTLPLDRNQAVHVDNIDDVAMKISSGTIGDYVSVVAEFTPGFPELNGDFNNGMGKLNGILDSFVHNFVYGSTLSRHDHDAAFAARDAIVDNKFEEALLGSMSGVLRYQDFDELTTIGFNDDEVLVMSSQDSFIPTSQGEGLVDQL